MATNKTDRSFKILTNRRVTDENKAFYEELGAETLTVTADQVWAESVPNDDPATGISNATVQFYSQLALTEDVTVASQESWYAADNDGYRLLDWIPDRFGSSYTARLYDNGGSQIFPTDTLDWFFDYPTGILTINGDASAFSQPFKLDGYRYVGAKGVATASPYEGAGDPVNIYVDLTGNDTTGDGTQALPYRTVQRAALDVPSVVQRDLKIKVGTGTWTAEDVNLSKYFSSPEFAGYPDYRLVVEGSFSYEQALTVSSESAGSNSLLRDVVVNEAFTVSGGFTEGNMFIVRTYEGVYEPKFSPVVAIDEGSQTITVHEYPNGFSSWIGFGGEILLVRLGTTLQGGLVTTIRSSNLIVRGLHINNNFQMKVTPGSNCMLNGCYIEARQTFLYGTESIVGNQINTTDPGGTGFDVIIKGGASKVIFENNNIFGSSLIEFNDEVTFTRISHTGAMSSGVREKFRLDKGAFVQTITSDSCQFDGYGQIFKLKNHSNLDLRFSPVLGAEVTTIASATSGSAITVSAGTSSATIYGISFILSDGAIGRNLSSYSSENANFAGRNIQIGINYYDYSDLPLTDLDELSKVS